jgi:cell division protein FtsW
MLKNMTKNKIKSGKIDYLLLGAAFFLLVLGIIIIASISITLSSQHFGITYYFLVRQFIIGIIPGLILGFILFRLDEKKLKKISLPALLISIVLCAMVFLPYIGVSAGGAKRWLNFLGNATIQPSEILKLTFIIYLATLFSKRIEKKDDNKLKTVFLPFIIILSVISVILIKQPDISTLIIIVITSLSIYFSLNTPLLHTIILLAIGVIIFPLLVLFASYRLKRILSFFNPESDPLGISYQINQALIAIGSGGIYGLGFGMSRQKLGFLPEPMTDTIFAIFSEESGFIGASLLILLFLVLFWRIMIIAKRSQDNFASIICLGIGIWIITQAFFNISAMVKLLPLSGIPLPFISYGGSHIIAELGAVGLLLRYSRSSYK